ncbi:MAG: nucleotide exchange factor GrpE [Myxococcota bacterium]
MSKTSEPPRAPEDLLIEIDPSLIEEALAAVDRRLQHGGDEAAKPASAPQRDGIELELSLEAPAAAPARPSPPDEEKRRLQVRLQDQAEQIRRLERELARVTETRDTFEKQARDLRKAHSDVYADFERFRQRTRKDLEEAERRGEDRVMRPLVDVYDNVERAWLHAVSDPAQILGGLQMIVEQFKRLLLRLGFERVDAERGTLFDPAQHEAVLHVRSDGALPGTVVDEVQAGFRLRGRLFRPARVTVSAPPPGTAD